MFTEDDLKAAHKRCIGNEAELLASDSCGCFHCLAIFSSSEIVEWINDSQGRTAQCPRCSIDSVLGSRLGYPITQEFLTKMQKHWFG